MGNLAQNLVWPLNKMFRTIDVSITFGVLKLMTGLSRLGRVYFPSLMTEVIGLLQGKMALKVGSDHNGFNMKMIHRWDTNIFNSDKFEVKYMYF